jgi:hypothetical protein
VNDREVKLEGAYPSTSEQAMEEVLTSEGDESFDFLEPEVCREFAEGMEIAKNYEASSEMVLRIKEGKFTMLNTGYTHPSGGHAVNVVFCGDHFAICNRGDRISAESIKFYRFDKSKMNLMTLKFILNTYFSKQTTREDGLLHQEMNIYYTLPLMLDAKLVEGEEQSPSILGSENKTQVMATKNQTAGNCAKSSALTGFAMGVFIKEYEKREGEEDQLTVSALVAKRCKSAMSFRMRSQGIKGLKNYLKDHPSESNPQIQALIDKATKKLGKDRIFRYLSDSRIAEIEKNISLASKDRRIIPPPILTSRDLYIILKRREDGSNFRLAAIPVDLDICAENLKRFSQESLLVSSEELELVSEVNANLEILYEI